MILCQKVKKGEKTSRRVREGIREKIGFGLDLKGQGAVSERGGLAKTTGKYLAPQFPR